MCHLASNIGCGVVQKEIVKMSNIRRLLSVLLIACMVTSVTFTGVPLNTYAEDKTENQLEIEEEIPDPSVTPAITETPTGTTEEPTVVPTEGPTVTPTETPSVTPTETPIPKKTPNLSASDFTISYSTGYKDYTINDYYTVDTEYDGAVTWSVMSGDDVIGIDASGNIKTEKTGTAEVKLTAPETDKFEMDETIVKVTVEVTDLGKLTLDDMQISTQTFEYTGDNTFTVTGGIDRNKKPTGSGDLGFTMTVELVGEPCVGENLKTTIKSFIISKAHADGFTYELDIDENEGPLINIEKCNIKIAPNAIKTTYGTDEWVSVATGTFPPSIDKKDIIKFTGITKPSENLKNEFYEQVIENLNISIKPSEYYVGKYANAFSVSLSKTDYDNFTVNLTDADDGLLVVNCETITDEEVFSRVTLDAENSTNSIVRDGAVYIGKNATAAFVSIFDYYDNVVFEIKKSGGVRGRLNKITTDETCISGNVTGPFYLWQGNDSTRTYRNYTSDSDYENNEIPEGKVIVDADFPNISFGSVPTYVQIDKTPDSWKNFETSTMSNTGCLVDVSATDDASGIKEMKYRIEKVTCDDNVTTVVTNALTDTKGWYKYSEGTDILIPSLKEGNFIVIMKTSDNVGNTCIAASTGIIIDTTSPTVEITGIDEDKPVRGDVKYTVKITDNGEIESGIAQIETTVYVDGVAIESVTDPSVYKNSYTLSKEKVDTILGIASPYDFTELGKAKTMELKGQINAMDANSNDVRLVVTVTDKAGNSYTADKHLMISNTVPELNVEYDNNDVKNEKYFNATRRMTVTCTARNFEESGAEVTVKTDEGGENTYTLAELAKNSVDGITFVSRNDTEEDVPVWGRTDNRKITYVFDIGKASNTDGGFSFKFSLTDGAGNVAAKTTSESEAPFDFVIDKVAPVMSVVYTDPNKNILHPGLNPSEMLYLNKNLTATLKLDEKHPSLKDSETGLCIGLLQKDNSWNDVKTYKEADIEAIKDITNWNKGTDGIYTGIMAEFKGDANYVLNFSYSDLAGNAVTLDPAYFSIDTQPPKGIIRITNGDTVTDYGSTLNDEVKMLHYSNAEISVSYEVEDETGGVGETCYYIFTPSEDDKGSFKGLTEEELEKVSWTRWDKALLLKCETSAVIYLKTSDRSGNTAYYNADGIIVENTAPDINISLPDIGSYDVYKGDVEFNITVTDPISGGTYSGLKDVSYTISNGSVKTQEGSYKDELTDPSARIQKIEKTETINAENNNSNMVTINVFAEDYAGNTYETEKTIAIDITYPEISLSYDNNSPRNDMYFNKGRRMTLNVTERNFDEQKLSVILTINGRKKTYSIKDIKKGKASGVEVIKDRFDSEEGVADIYYTDKRTNTYVIGFGTGKDKIDIDYEISFSVTDTAGNKADEANADDSVSAFKFTVDEVAPVLDIVYTGRNGIVKASTDEKNPLYDTKGITAMLSVTERNFCTKKSDNTATVYVTSSDASGNDFKAYDNKNISDAEKITGWKTDGNKHSFTMTRFKKDANYSLSYTYEDLAGNKAIYTAHYFTVDSTPPYASLHVSTGETEGTYASLSDILKFWHYDNVPIPITNTASDSISGVAAVEYATYVPGAEDRGSFKGLTDAQVKSLNWTKWTGDSISVTPDNASVIYLKVTDRAGNVTYVNTEDGIISDATSPTPPEITITLNSKGSQGIYNSDVPFTISVTDPLNGGTYSGLRSVSYTITSNGVRTQNGNFDAELSDRTARIQSLTKNLTVDSSLNNTNHVMISVTATDYAGNTTTETKEIKIDTTAPSISVTYDINNPSNGKYYNSVRTATVTVLERNFDPSLATLMITNTLGATASVSSWSVSPMAGESDNAANTCTVTFSEDGDYTFTVAVTDGAGNNATLGRTDDFVIDRTAPIITVTFDNNNYLNGKYFNASRIATISVEERNFDALLFKQSITTDDGKIPTLSAWSFSGTAHKATLVFDIDGAYNATFDITDLAGNKAKIVTVPEFVIDKTKPVIEITGLKDKTAYKSEVTPEIKYTDKNIRIKSFEINLEGARNGSMFVNGTTKEIKNGAIYSMSDIEHVAENDDIYKMTILVYDLAGNLSTAIVTFSVNRFGSNFYFDNATQKLIDGYYINAPESLVIYEVNVNSLKNNEVYYVFDGNTHYLKEGEDYEVTPVKGSDGWMTYKYVIYDRIFTREGLYEIHIASEDGAGNNQDSKLKGAPISLMLDLSSPSVSITGIDKDGRYRDKERYATIVLNDNVALSLCVLYINGEKYAEYTAEEIESLGGKISVMLEGSFNWQTLQTVAYDAAGNVTDTGEVRVLITSNIFIQWLNNKPLLYGSLIILALLIFFIVIWKRRKKEE